MFEIMCKYNSKCDGFHTHGCPHAVMRMEGRDDNPDFRCERYYGPVTTVPCYDVNCENCPELQCNYNRRLIEMNCCDKPNCDGWYPKQCKDAIWTNEGYEEYPSVVCLWSMCADDVNE